MEAEEKMYESVFFKKMETKQRNKDIVPLWERTTLTIGEASIYSSIGRTKLRQMVNRADCPFAIWIGHKCLIKRKPFEEYMEQTNSIGCVERKESRDPESNNERRNFYGNTEKKR